jgi:hypothetical protein
VSDLRAIMALLFRKDEVKFKKAHLKNKGDV